jgi:hypothetical protein
MPKRHLSSVFTNCFISTKEIFGDVKFKYDKNLGEKLNIRGLKNRLTRRMEKAGLENLSIAKHQPSILLVNYLIELLCHLSVEKESFLPVCDLSPQWKEGTGRVDGVIKGVGGEAIFISEFTLDILEQ